MSDLQIFNHPSFGEVEVTIIEGKEWFGATKVAKVLGYSNPQKAVRDHCREEGCTNRSALTSGGTQEMKFIDEGNLYRLIVRSKLPAAEKFERWVFDEVLPSIRMHGAYMTPNTIEKALTNPDFIIGLATKLKEEQIARKKLENKIEQDKPKVIFADSVSAAKTSILIGELAKLIKQNGINIGPNRLFEWMRQNGYLMKSGSSRNMPTQRAMEMGLFEVRESSITNPDGSIRITKTPKVTGKGQVYFINKFRGGNVA